MLYTEVIMPVEGSVVDQFINQKGLVQQAVPLMAVYKSFPNMNSKYIVCYDENDRVVGALPFVHYRHEWGDVIHSLPYLGYGGVCVGQGQRAEIIDSLMKGLVDYGREHNVLLATICTPPFLDGADINSYKNSFKPDFERNNFYQYIETSSDYSANMTSKNRNNLKRNLKRAKEGGIHLKEDYTEDSLLFWYEKIYVQRLAETGAMIYPFSVFNELRKSHQRKRIIIQYAMKDNLIVGAGISLKQPNSLDNFMRVIDPKYANTGAGTLLDDWSIKYAKSEGFLFYNWQSCDRIDSSIFKYKATWGAKVGYHYYLTKIIKSIDEFKEIPLIDIKEAYRGVYVMPYNEFIYQ